MAAQQLHRTLHRTDRLCPTFPHGSRLLQQDTNIIMNPLTPPATLYGSTTSSLQRQDKQVVSGVRPPPPGCICQEAALLPLTRTVRASYPFSLFPAIRTYIGDVPLILQRRASKSTTTPSSSIRLETSPPSTSPTLRSSGPSGDCATSTGGLYLDHG
jgi:hypothetical protein